jgi:hypothetical protein
MAASDDEPVTIDSLEEDFKLLFLGLRLRALETENDGNRQIPVDEFRTKSVPDTINKMGAIIEDLTSRRADISLIKLYEYLTRSGPINLFDTLLRITRRLIRPPWGPAYALRPHIVTMILGRIRIFKNCFIPELIRLIEIGLNRIIGVDRRPTEALLVESGLFNRGGKRKTKRRGKKNSKKTRKTRKY